MSPKPVFFVAEWHDPEAKTATPGGALSLVVRRGTQVSGSFHRADCLQKTQETQLHRENCV
jgi:hypothetical protein